MELASVLRHMPSIDGGRWVAADEVPTLGDMRVKVRGLGSAIAREELARLQRNGMDGNEAVHTVAIETCLLDIEGLVDKGRPVSVDEIRPALLHPRGEKLALPILRAIEAVDGTTEAKAEALSKN